MGWRFPGGWEAGVCQPPKEECRWTLAISSINYASPPSGPTLSIVACSQVRLTRAKTLLREVRPGGAPWGAAVPGRVHPFYPCSFTPL